MNFKKIAIVTNSMGGGGAERAMNLLANELQARGHHVTLVPVNKGVSDLIQPKCSVIAMNRDVDSGFISNIRTLKSFLRKMVDIKPSFVILNCDLPELLGLFLPKHMNIIIVEHANPAWSNRSLIGRLIRVLHFLKGTTFVAVSSHLNIWPTTLKPSEVTLNIIPASEITVDKHGNAAQINRLVYIGRLAEIQKRPSWLIGISSQLNIPVLFIGDGAELERLKAYAVTRKVTAQFVGHQLDPWEFISIDDLVVVPSSFEGDGLVVIEAIARGIPVILSDIPDFRRFRLNTNFYAATEKDFVLRIIEGNRQTTNFLVKDSDRARILAGRDRQSVVTSWEKIFHQLGEKK